MIATERLILRPFVGDDRAALRAMWGDPAVMADLGGARDAAAADAIVARHEGYRVEGGLGFWVVERRADGMVLGHCGLKPGAPDTPIEGEVETGWAFARAAWGHGYASEAARAALTWGWASTAASRIVAITSRRNAASIAVMRRLGMEEAGGFRHPGYPAGDPAGDSVIHAIARP